MLTSSTFVEHVLKPNSFCHPAQGDRQKGLVCDKKGAQAAPFTEPILHRAYHPGMGGFSPLFPRPFVWENWDEAPQPELRAQRPVQGALHSYQLRGVGDQVCDAPVMM